MVSIEEYNKIGYDIIGCAFEVRKIAGRGLRENYYHRALEWELQHKGYDVKHKVVIPVIYKGEVINDAYEADIIVNNLVIVETKAVTAMNETECRQIITYMKLMSMKLGYLINFGSKDFGFGSTLDKLPFNKGIYRFVNGL